MFLVKMNFVAFVTAMNVLATGKEKDISTAAYLSLPPNSSNGLFNFIFRGANIVSLAETANIYKADIAVNTERRRASMSAPNFIRAIGDLKNLTGLETYDASGFYVFQRLGSLKVGELGEFMFYRTDRVVDWRAADLEKAYPPDAIFSGGRWFKGEGVVPRLK